MAAAARRWTISGAQKLEDLVPKRIGRLEFCHGERTGLAAGRPDLKAIYSQVLTRVYSDGQNPPIMLLLAQSSSQTGFLQIHRPETCYTAGGYQISPLTPHPQVGSKMVKANRMEASGNWRSRARRSTGPASVT